MTTTPLQNRIIEHLEQALPEPDHALLHALVESAYEEGRNSGLMSPHLVDGNDSRVCQSPGCYAVVYNGHHCAAGHLQQR